MALVDIAGHTIETDLIGDGIIIDIGCRGFEFSNYFTTHHPKNGVVCVDPDLEVFRNRIAGHNQMWYNVAIAATAGESAIYRNGEATCLKEIDPDQSHEFTPCRTITMADLYQVTGKNVDVLKLDCEGAEYIILGETFEPVPKQISVEFHYHCVPELHNANYPGIIERLLKDYDIKTNAWEERHGCGYNFWDVLFVRK